MVLEGSLVRVESNKRPLRVDRAVNVERVSRRELVFEVVLEKVAIEKVASEKVAFEAAA